LKKIPIIGENKIAVCRWINLIVLFFPRA